MLTVCRSGITTLSLDLHDAPSRRHRRDTVGVGRGYERTKTIDSTARYRFPAIAISDRFRVTPGPRRTRRYREDEYRTTPLPFPRGHHHGLYETNVAIRPIPSGRLHDAEFLDGFTRALEVFEYLAVGSDGVGEDRIDLRRVE